MVEFSEDSFSGTVKGRCAVEEPNTDAPWGGVGLVDLVGSV